MFLKSEFKKRLLNVKYEIDKALMRDFTGTVNRTSNLMPSIFSLFSYCWCKDVCELYKKNR